MCEYCDHDTNEDAKRFPLFGDNDRDEAFIDEDNYLSVYTKNGDWVGGPSSSARCAGSPSRVQRSLMTNRLLPLSGQLTPRSRTDPEKILNIFTNAY